MARDLSYNSLDPIPLSDFLASAPSTLLNL